ncbi:MAG TPA: Rrf2 family transcriptional regulator [Terriglobales bacterium]|nr:Rrf2 family transcriptional regulator [Terriglobales bacterium]
MKISQKGLYALEAMIMLARHYHEGPVKIHEIAVEEHLPEKFLEIILIELKNARLVESTRGARGGYQLRRSPAEIRVSDIVRIIDGPLAPFGDVDQLRASLQEDALHRPLYKLFLNVRNAIAKILENTSVADIAGLVALPDSEPKQRSRMEEGNAAPANGGSATQPKKTRVLTLASR